MGTVPRLRGRGHGRAARSTDGGLYGIVVPAWVTRSTSSSSLTPSRRSTSVRVRGTPNLHTFPTQLPDPGVVWDSLLKRDKFVAHPSGISSLLFGFAQLIVHSIFQTDPRNGEVNEASSYLDLSPIYGNTRPSRRRCVALAVLFSRNHNDIAKRLFDVNEQGRYAEWDSLDDEGKKRQDHDLFNTARNVNCGHFVNVILQDYIRVILNLSKTDSTWSLVPTGEIKSLLGGRLPRGGGNHVSVEFNILYRWHASASEKDTKWLEGLMFQYNGGKPFGEMTTEDFQIAARKALDDMKGGPESWTFLGFKRTESGAFRDEDIIKVLLEATDDVAWAFEGCALPEVMRVIDLLGMEAARKTVVGGRARRAWSASLGEAQGCVVASQLPPKPSP
ncbi:hypothetical protein JCM8208_000715 [Rhodotorula glutinis]